MTQVPTSSRNRSAVTYPTSGAAGFGMLDCTTDGCQLLPALVLYGGGIATPTKSRPALLNKGMGDGQWYGGTNCKYALNPPEFSTLKTAMFMYSLILSEFVLSFFSLHRTADSAQARTNAKLPPQVAHRRTISFSRLTIRAPLLDPRGLLGCARL
jgi:hypothetical protein